MNPGNTSVLISLTASLFLCSCADGAKDSELTTTAVQVAADGPGAIERVDYYGDGCPQDGVSTALSGDSQAVTSLFSAFQPVIGPQSGQGVGSLGCVLAVRVNVPAGWSYTADSVTARGFVLLDDGVSAQRNAVYWIAGNGPRAIPPATWAGPADDDYTQNDIGPQAPLAWSPCGGGQDLLIAAQLNLDNHGNRDASGMATIDSIDTELQWRRCE